MLLSGLLFFHLVSMLLILSITSSFMIDHAAGHWSEYPFWMTHKGAASLCLAAPPQMHMQSVILLNRASVILLGTHLVIHCAAVN